MNLKSNAGLIEAAELIIHTIQKDAKIRKSLASIGFNDKRVQEGISIRQNALDMQEANDQYYDDRWAVSQQVSKDVESAIKLFKMHVKIARIVFYKDPGTIRFLKIQRFATGTWKLIRQADHFYTYLLYTDKDLSGVGIDKPMLEQAKASIDAVISGKYERAHKKGMAENSTVRKQKAFKELKNWVVDFRKIARFAFRDTPQYLEAFGIEVPSSVK